eukprot:GFYU01009388.1.p1 GENE.GFYU01009388.1~~GFYU01009388.1.p1  ORF type:complete len:752 (-),score=125.59 GFYU01009388.1:75-2330(-)
MLLSAQSLSMTDARKLSLYTIILVTLLASINDVSSIDERVTSLDSRGTPPLLSTLHQATKWHAAGCDVFVNASTGGNATTDGTPMGSKDNPYTTLFDLFTSLNTVDHSNTTICIDTLGDYTTQTRHKCPPATRAKGSIRVVGVGDRRLRVGVAEAIWSFPSADTVTLDHLNIAQDCALHVGMPSTVDNVVADVTPHDGDGPSAYDKNTELSLLDCTGSFTLESELSSVHIRQNAAEVPAERLRISAAEVNAVREFNITSVSHLLVNATIGRRMHVTGCNDCTFLLLEEFITPTRKPHPRVHPNDHHEIPTALFAFEDTVFGSPHTSGPSSSGGGGDWTPPESTVLSMANKVAGGGRVTMKGCHIHHQVAVFSRSAIVIDTVATSRLLMTTRHVAVERVDVVGGEIDLFGVERVAMAHIDVTGGTEKQPREIAIGIDLDPRRGFQAHATLVDVTIHDVFTTKEAFVMFSDDDDDVVLKDVTMQRVNTRADMSITTATKLMFGERSQVSVSNVTSGCNSETVVQRDGTVKRRYIPLLSVSGNIQWLAQWIDRGDIRNVGGPECAVTCTEPGEVNYNSLIQCTYCPSGTERVLDTSMAPSSTNGRCQSCVPGNHNPYRNGTCVPCLPGSVTASTGATVCDVCESPTYADRPGMANCTHCPPNRAFHRSDEECKECEEGEEYSVDGGTCVQCAIWMTSEPGGDCHVNWRATMVAAGGFVGVVMVASAIYVYTRYRRNRRQREEDDGFYYTQPLTR